MSDIEAVLAAHGPAGDWHCSCGEDLFGGSAAYGHAVYRSHLAAALAPLIAERERPAAARALREAAEALLPETLEAAHAVVCANQYRSDRTSAHDALDVAADWLRDRAAALDPEEQP